MDGISFYMQLGEIANYRLNYKITKREFNSYVCTKPSKYEYFVLDQFEFLLLLSAFYVFIRYSAYFLSITVTDIQFVKLFYFRSIPLKY